MFEGVTQRIQVLAVDGEKLFELCDFSNVADRLEVLRIARACLRVETAIRIGN